MSKGRTRLSKPLMAGLALWILAFSLACRLSPDSISGNMAEEESSTFMSRLLGASRSAFSQHFYEEADRYFHQGVGRYYEKQLTDTWLFRLAERITPADHVELQGENLEEIMPWLEFATRFDPQNMDAYLVAAFWLNKYGKTDIALQALNEAQKKNTGDYRVFLARARLYLQQGKHREAATEMDTGIALWPGKLKPDDPEALLDLSNLMVLRAALLEVSNEPQKALELYRHILKLFPDRQAVQLRATALEQGEDTRSWALNALETIFFQHGDSHIMGGGDHTQHEHDADHDHGDHSQCQHP